MQRTILLICTLLLSFGFAQASNYRNSDDVMAQTKIVGYFPNWGIYPKHRNYYVEDVPFDQITHLNFSFAAIDDNLELKSSDPYADFFNPFNEKPTSIYKGIMGQLQKYKELYPHISMMLSVGGWTFSELFPTLSNNPQQRQLFANKAVEFMRQYGFDGIDIDWEFPGEKRELNPNASEKDKENFTLLLKDLRLALDQAGDEDGRYYQLSTAVGAGGHHMAHTELDQYPQYVDFINIMSYDLHGSWEKITNYQSPLYPNPYLAQDGLTIAEAVKRMLEAGIPSRKIVIGTPFYSRGWKEVAPESLIKDNRGEPLVGLGISSNGGAKGSWDDPGSDSGVFPYYELIKKIGNDGFSVYRDPYAKVPYLYSPIKQEFYTFEDEISVRQKARFVKENDLGGVIIWELSADTQPSLDGVPSLTESISDELFSQP